MASSGYYYNLYKSYRDSTKTYESNLRKLNDYHNKVINNFNDDVRYVNDEVDDLLEKLEIAVRYSSGFDTNVTSIEKEPQVSEDTYMSSVITELSEEITRVTNLMNQHAGNRDYYYEKYKEKKEEERAEWLAKLKGGDK